MEFSDREVPTNDYSINQEIIIKLLNLFYLISASPRFFILFWRWSKELKFLLHKNILITNR